MIRKILIQLIFISAIVFAAKAKEPFYPASEIPASLLENSNSVLRNSQLVLEIFAEDKIRYTIKEVITILNKNGDDEGVLYIPYNSNSKPDINSANFYDKNGDLINKQEIDFSKKE